MTTETVQRLAPQYTQLEDGSLAFVFDLESDHQLGISARDIRKERTGVHATARVTMNNIVLAWGVLNAEKDEERTRLCNSAFAQFADVDAAIFKKHDLKHALDLFCDGLWDRHIGLINVEEMEGDDAADVLPVIVDGLVIRGGGTALFGLPGLGKSSIGLLLAVSIDAGIASIFPVREQCRVLYINLERSRQSMQRRLARVNRALGQPDRRPLAFINERGKSLADIIDAARRTIRERQIGVVVLDSISRAGLGDLNENQTGNKVIDSLNGLCETWIGIGHTPRSDDSHLFGSVMVDAGIDVGVQLRSQVASNGQKVGIVLVVTKANDIRKPGPQFFALEYDEYGITVARKAHSSEFPELAAGSKKAGVGDQVFDYLLDVGKASATEIAQETGLNRSDISNVLNRDPRFVRLGKEGKSVMYGVKDVAHTSGS